MPRARGVRLSLGESFHMRITRLAAIPIIALIALAVPGVSSANTGSVTCDSTGVVFNYNADFGRTKVSTETVNGVTQQFTVPAHTAVTHTWPGLFGTLTVGATWSGGSIPTVTLHCPAPSTPPPPPPPVSPPPPVAPPPVVTPPPAPPVAPPAPPAVTPSTPSTPAPSPTITLKKRALATTVPAGSVVKYQLTVTAKGGTAHGVVVCDKLPANMTYASLGTATMDNGRACWTIGDLTGSITLSLKARVDSDAPAGSLTNNSTATSSNAGRAKAHATVNVPAKHGVKGKLKRTAGVTG
jgi:uncharacterized repeat protein (TIGR01451 family)